MKRININDLRNNREQFYIIAETAFSHEGDIDYIRQQINHASEGHADGIKFQILLNVDDSYSIDYPAHRVLKSWIFTSKQWLQLIEYAKNEKKLDVIVLPIDNAAVEFCIENNLVIDAIEIHSINFNQIPILEKLNDFKKLIILGIGGRTPDEIKYCINLINSKETKHLSLMYGFQAFPTNYNEINMSRIKKYVEIYNLIMGYADHTSYDCDLSLNLINYAFLNGARLFEKHLVLEKGIERTDYHSAVDKCGIIEIRKSLEQLVSIQGDDNLSNLTDNEKRYRAREKQIITVMDIEEGDVFTEYNIGYKVSSDKSDFLQKDYSNLINKKASCYIPNGTCLKQKHVII